MPAGTKRKSDASAASASSARKRSKTKATAPDYSDAKELIESILAGDAEDGLGAGDAMKIAQYARALEEGAVGGAGQDGNANGKSAAEVKSEALKLRAVCVSGIEKQLVWKPSCKSGTAKWSYDNVCTDPAVFARMLGLDAPPKWKMHKYTPEEFQDVMGSISGSAMYDNLELMKSVTVRYDAEESTFKISGVYGAPRHVNKGRAY
ncbi:hypothetical protein MKEN_00550700 [Mycena kentingensis (nom. inval.)]|nr:hypothetical protein MKEN_00550700 [Mycena kentingensis (nom. inval.)]